MSEVYHKNHAVRKRKKKKKENQLTCNLNLRLDHTYQCQRFIMNTMQGEKEKRELMLHNPALNNEPTIKYDTDIKNELYIKNLKNCS